MAQVNGIVVWTEGIKAELAKRLPKQRKTQRDKLAVLVATMLHVGSANLVELAAGLPRESDRWDMGYQWISRFLANDLVCCDRDCPDFGGSCRFGKGRVFIGDPVKSMPQPSAERAVVDCATDLEQQIGASVRPSHLLRFVHAPVDQEVCCAFGNRRSDPLTGTVSFSIVDQPRGLASEIFIDRMQRVPQLARRYVLRAPAALALEDMHDLADPLDAALSILRLAIP